MADFNPYQPPSAALDPTDAPPAPPPTGLARTLVTTLGVFGLASVVGILSDLDQWNVLTDARTGDLEMARAEASDTRALLAAVQQLAAALAAAIPFCMWILRANRAAKALAPWAVRTSSAWAVGWYFVPIANLWKPYQAMKEIWTASLPGDDGDRWSSPLPLWWTMWISIGVLGRMASKAADSAGNDIERLIWAVQLELAGDIVAVLLAGFAARVVWTISGLQADRAREGR